MSSALPPRQPPRPPFSPATSRNVVPPGGGGRKIRPLVYAIGVAGIVGSGALIGAILKMSQDEKKAKKVEQQHAQQGPATTTTESQRNTIISEYDKHISILETKRANLIGQKIALERKISDFREGQRKAAAEEQEKKEFGLKR